MEQIGKYDIRFTASSIELKEHSPNPQSQPEDQSKQPLCSNQSQARLDNIIVLKYT